MDFLSKVQSCGNNWHGHSPCVLCAMVDFTNFVVSECRLIPTDYYRHTESFVRMFDEEACEDV